MDTYASDDYCGVNIGNTHYYYGYEVEKDDEWCFQVTVNDKVVFTRKTSELSTERGDVTNFLVLGAMAYAKEGVDKPA